MEQLEQGRPFVKVFDDFMQWCGEDYLFCTWGPLDLTELQKNMKYYDVEPFSDRPLKFYDVQKLFSIAFEDRKSRRTLEYAVEFLNIEKDIPFHRAFSDAYYTAKVLAKHKNIVAVKEASGNIGYTAKLIAACGDDLDVYSGNDDMIVPIMSLGGKGVISVLSHVLPKETHLMAQYCLENNFAEASKLQIKYLDLINNLFVEVNPIPVKEAMNLIGVNVGGCRMPLYPMSDENREKLKASLAKHGLIK